MLAWDYWLWTCTCLRVSMSQTGTFSPALCREEWVGGQCLRTPQEVTEGSGRLVEPLPKVTLPLGPPSPAPPESLGGLAAHPAGGLGVWEGSPAHTQRSLLWTNITLEKILHRWKHPAVLGLRKASFTHLSLEEWKTLSGYMSQDPLSTPPFACRYPLPFLYPSHGSFTFAGAKLEEDSYLIL